MFKLKAALLLILFGVTFVNLALFINKHINSYTYPFNPQFLEKLYGQSQYVRYSGEISMLPDETIYSYAAWRYMNGENPAIFNADQPPFGKYFIGLSEKFFQNEKIPGPFFNILSLVALFFLSFLILKNAVWAMGIVMLFSFEKLFIAQMLYAPLLDNIQLFFILLGFIFYILSLRNSRFLLPAFIGLGLVMSTKFWITGAIIYIIWLIHGFLLKNFRRLAIFFMLSPTSILTMMIVYLPSFIQGDTIRRFFGVQRYIYEFHKGKFNFDPAAVWDLLLFNRWHVPWEGVIKPAVDWQWTWPILTLLMLVSLIKIIRFKTRFGGLATSSGVIVIWIIVYFILLSVSTVLPRYILPVLPFIYILAFSEIKSFLSKATKISI